MSRQPRKPRKRRPKLLDPLSEKRLAAARMIVEKGITDDEQIALAVQVEVPFVTRLRGICRPLVRLSATLSGPETADITELIKRFKKAPFHVLFKSNWMYMMCHEDPNINYKAMMLAAKLMPQLCYDSIAEPYVQRPKNRHTTEATVIEPEPDKDEDAIEAREKETNLLENGDAAPEDGQNVG